MRKLITLAALLLVANGASANGFSPWSGEGFAQAPADAERAYVESAGFAPWRERTVTTDVVEAPRVGEIAVNQGESNIFRPWS